MKEAMQRAMVTYFVAILGKEAVEAVVRAMNYNINGSLVLTFNGQKDALVSMMGHARTCECITFPIIETSNSCAETAWESLRSTNKAEVFDDFCKWVNEENLPVFRDVLSASH